MDFNISSGYFDNHEMIHKLGIHNCNDKTPYMLTRQFSLETRVKWHKNFVNIPVWIKLLCSNTRWNDCLENYNGISPAWIKKLCCGTCWNEANRNICLPLSWNNSLFYVKR